MQGLIKKDFDLYVKEPFKLDFNVWVLKRRPHYNTDLWENNKYSRVVAINNNLIKVEIIQSNKNTLKVRAITNQKNQDIQKDLVTLITKMFGLDKNLNEFYTLSSKDKHLENLVKKFKGLKPVRYPSIFEALVNAISCQQLTLNYGLTILDRLVRNYGKKFEYENSESYAFPEAEDLKDVLIEDLKNLGYSFNKARAIKELSEAVSNKNLNLDFDELASDEDIIEYLTAIRGVGRWTAEYVLLRGLGRTNIFPGDDVAAQKNLKALFGLNEKPGYEEIKKLTEHIAPYAGMIYFHMFLNKFMDL